MIDKTVMNRDELVQLKEELKVMVSLNHKNIVKLHDVYEVR